MANEIFRQAFSRLRGTYSVQDAVDSILTEINAHFDALERTATERTQPFVGVAVAEVEQLQGFVEAIVTDMNELYAIANRVGASLDTVPELVQAKIDLLENEVGRLRAQTIDGIVHNDRVNSNEILFREGFVTRDGVDNGSTVHVDTQSRAVTLPFQGESDVKGSVHSVRVEDTGSAVTGTGSSSVPEYRVGTGKKFGVVTAVPFDPDDAVRRNPSPDLTVDDSTIDTFMDYELAYGYTPKWKDTTLVEITSRSFGHNGHRTWVVNSEIPQGGDVEDSIMRFALRVPLHRVVTLTRVGVERRPIRAEEMGLGNLKRVVITDDKGETHEVHKGSDGNRVSTFIVDGVRATDVTFYFEQREWHYAPFDMDVFMRTHTFDQPPFEELEFSATHVGGEPTFLDRDI
jgi:hypothetical protein